MTRGAPTFRGRLGAALCAATLVAASLGGVETSSPGAIDRERLAQVRAAFLLNFVRYTEWPATSFDSAESPYFVVVLDDDDVAAALETLAERAGTTSGRALRVVRMRSPRTDSERLELEQILRGCHLAYLGEHPDPELVESLSPASVLTVAADDEFVRVGGMIALVVEGTRVTFDVNTDAIREHGLLLSSRVLRLARNVDRER